MRISDWSSDVCSSDIREREQIQGNAWQIDQMLITQSDEAEAAGRERLFRYASEGKEHLTPEPRDAIERTVQRQKSPSDRSPERVPTSETGRRLPAPAPDAPRPTPTHKRPRAP